MVMMNKKYVWIMSVCFLVGGCNTVQKTEFDPQYLASIQQRQPLQVPYHQWIAEHCYPKRSLRNNKWVDIKVCDKK